MPETVETSSASLLDNNSLPSTGDVDLVLQEPGSEATPDRAEQSLLSPSEEFSQEKREVSVLDPINNVIDRVKVWWNGRGVAAAETKLQGLQEQSQELEGKLSKVQAGLDNSANVQDALRAARERTGLGLRNEKLEYDRPGVSAKAVEDQQALSDSLRAVNEKIAAVQEQKKSYEVAREEGRGRIVERFQAKVDQHQGWIEGYDDRISTATDEIEDKSAQLVLFAQERASLESVLNGELLPGDVKEVEWSIEQIRLNEHRIELEKQKSLTQREKLVKKRDGVVTEQNKWKEKIAPTKKDVISTDTQQDHDITSTDPATPQAVDVVINTAGVDQREAYVADVSQSERELNKLPENIQEAASAVIDSWDDADRDDQVRALSFLKAESRGHEKRGARKEKNFFQSLIEFLELFDLTSPDSNKKKS